MKKSITFFVAFFLVLNIFAQDTLVVQTLTFDSITTRRGIWQFPEEGEFRKILMYYTLKCDPQTTHDPYNCGEWDYLTYTNVWDHTGVWDSTLYHHPNYTYINGNTTDSLLLREQPTWNYYRKMHNTITYLDTTSISNWTIGDGSVSSNEIIRSSEMKGKSIFIWKAVELLNQGISEGAINGVKLHINSSTGELKHFTIKMGHTNLDSIIPEHHISGLQKVYFNSLLVNESGWYDFNFPETYAWDGSSNLLVELSYESAEENNNIELAVDDYDWNCGIVSAGENYAINLDGQMDFLDAADDTYFNSDFTFEAWLFKKNNNNWSRVFDFGNGPNQSNVIVTFSKSTGGNLSVHVNNQSGSKSFETDEPLPLNEWTHIAVTLTNHIAWLYINGDFSKNGLLQQPDDVVRTNNFIGKSNWTNDAYADGMIDEFRVFNYARSAEEIKANYNKTFTDPSVEPGLLLYYNFNENGGEAVLDLSSSGNDAQCYGLPSWHSVSGEESFLDFMQHNSRPQVIFERLEYNDADIQSTAVIDSVINAADQIVLFQDEDDPTLPTDTIKRWKGGYTYVYEDGIIYDSVYNSYEEIMYKEEIPYYGEPFEIIERYEIGRFITPYGIGLDLGPQGFRWIYDVTDYAYLLQGEVDLNAGNQQELIDLKFVFITGTPPRDVLSMDRIWGPRASYSYKSLDSNFVLQDTTYPIIEEAESVKVRTRLTGHGHQSNSGNYPHCCEWKDNTHYLYVNDEEIASWHIWQTHDCALNPVYPQGGTWPGAREGWCPGDRVKDHDFEIMEYISGNEVSLDYDITPVPPNNLGMGNGNYIVAMQLFQYGPAANNVDAEIFDVLAPTTEQYYSRTNPVCNKPKVVLRNNGTSNLGFVEFHYHVSGGEEHSYIWNGNLKPNHTTIVTLPVSNESFWVGDGTNKFQVSLSIPFGPSDEYADNNYYETQFEMPDLHSEPMVLWLKTNNQGFRYTLSITDIEGNYIVYRENLDNNTIYYDTLDYEDGCYKIELIDSQDMGLYYWANPGQGSGYLRLHRMDETVIKNFEPEFGRLVDYAFSFGEITHVQEPNLDMIIDVYPNPVSEQLTIRINDLEGSISFQLFDSFGRLVFEEDDYVKDIVTKEINMQYFSSGIYFLNVIHDKMRLQEKIVKN